MAAVGVNAYRETRVKTAGQGALIVMLYDEAIRQLEASLGLIVSNGNDAEGKVAASDIEVYHKGIVKAQEIIGELMVALDMEKGGDVAKNLLALYIFFNQELLALGVKADKTKLASVVTMMSDLRDAWVVAARDTVEQTPAVRPVLDING
jgi:flagellar protein FliS